MKKSAGLIFLAIISLFYFSSCEEKVNAEKEKEAIKNAFEQEKSAFFNQDYVTMSGYYVNDPSTVKMFIGEKGISRFDGWDKINIENQKETSDTTWDRTEVKASFLNYEINVIDETAWVLCDTHWEGVFKGDPLKMDQFRISVMKKINDQWKFGFIAIYAIPDAQ
jgi:hypothetical protein